LVSFYLGESPDGSGRMLDEIHTWGYHNLEDVHDYIQWLFPLAEKSSFNPDAPLLDVLQMEAFRTDERLKAKVIRSFKLMLSFYGLRCDETDQRVTISTSGEFPQRKRIWLNNGNHNYLRITRILTSLRLLGLGQYAQALFDFLDRLYREESGRIGAVTYAYWKQAVGKTP